jgi:hypothetical protein
MPPFQTARISSGLHQVIGGFVEQNLAQSAAENDPEHAVEEQVVELLGLSEARS